MGADEGSLYSAKEAAATKALVSILGRGLQVEFERLGLTVLGKPKERIWLFIDATLDNRAVLAERGCPMGSLCAELLKDGGELAKRSNALFAEPMM
ncbi:MAG: hypothetical protein ACTHNL_17175 [Devosia sp.]